MKKISLFIIALTLICLTLLLSSCKHDVPDNESSPIDSDTTAIALPDSTTVDTKTDVEAEINTSSDADILVERYNSKEWDGEKVELNGTSYRLEKDGSICIVDDYDSSGGIVAGHVDIPREIRGRIVCFDKGVGTFVFMAEDGKITLFKSHKQVLSFNNPLAVDLTDGRVEGYCFGNSLLAIHKGSAFCVVKYASNSLIFSRDDVLDSSSGDDSVRISVFGGKNYKVTANGDLVELKSRYYKFPETLDDGRLGREFYIGGYIDDGRYVYLYDNGDGQSYTMTYHNVTDDEIKVLSKNVLDAEYELGRMIYYDGQAVYQLSTKTLKTEKVKDGQISGLGDTWTEDESVRIYE